MEKMTYGEKVSFLRQYHFSLIKLSSLMEEREMWFAIGTKIVSGGDGMPHGNDTTSKVERSAITIMELTDQINDEINHIAEVRNQVKAVIDRFPEGKKKTLLTLRYINNFTFSRIAEEMDISERAVYKLHKNIITRLEI